MSTAEGRVLATFGREHLVRDASGEEHRCVAKGRSLRIVCGDRVSFSPADGDGPGRIEAVLERRNELSRPDRRGRTQALAANVDWVWVVIAPRPTPDPFMLDRYLATAELMPAEAGIIVNKSDIAPSDFLRTELDDYEALGYPVLHVSAITGELHALETALNDAVSIMVGQSGVGKSSLVNRLIPGVEQAVEQLSASSAEGRHTTTASTWFDLPRGGALIDSPGVRDFAPPAMPLREVGRAYREIRDAARGCRFDDCLHFREPDCAVMAAVESGGISERRYRSYRRLLNLMRELDERSGYGSS